MDGRYEAEGIQVWKRPTRTETGLRMGCGVLQINDNLSDPEAVAKLVAEALNAHRDANPADHD
jgi:hypothetical protein